MVTIDNNPWFIAADVCKALGLQNPSVAIKALDDSEWAKTNLGQRGLGAVLIISESGLYKLVMRSDKPEAKGFQDWVTKVVLPAIRKDGAYIMGEEKVVTGDFASLTPALQPSLTNDKWLSSREIPKVKFLRDLVMIGGDDESPHAPVVQP